MMNRPDGPRTVAFALCGSFCSFSAVLPQVRRLRALGWRVLPILSCSAAALDTRFGTAAALRAQLQEMTGETPLTTLQQVEPLGPKGMAQALIIAPATGTTMAMLAAGLSATPVTLAAKSLLRGGRPVVLAPSTTMRSRAAPRLLPSCCNGGTTTLCPSARTTATKSPAASKVISPSSPIRWKAPCAVCSCSRFCCNAGAICDI